jgi:hypothetical protein
VLEPPPVTSAAPRGEGLITVAAEPFAIVRIDGAEVGSTPILGRKLSAGEHEVVLVSPDSGAVRLRRRIVIDPGEHERVILRDPGM